MAQYRVKKRYRSGGYDGQQRDWKPGDVVELSDDLAAWVGRDGGDVLEPVVAAEAERTIEAPPHDRMVRGRRKREVSDNENQ